MANSKYGSSDQRASGLGTRNESGEAWARRPGPAAAPTQARGTEGGVDESQYAVGEVVGDTEGVPRGRGTEAGVEAGLHEEVSSEGAEAGEEYVEATFGQMAAAAEAGEETALSDLRAIEGYEGAEAGEEEILPPQPPLQDAGDAREDEQKEYFPILAALAPALISAAGPTVAAAVMSRLSPRARRLLRRLSQTSTLADSGGTVVPGSVGRPSTQQGRYGTTDQRQRASTQQGRYGMADQGDMGNGTGEMGDESGQAGGGSPLVDDGSPLVDDGGPLVDDGARPVEGAGETSSSAGASGNLLPLVARLLVASQQRPGADGVPLHRTAGEAGMEVDAAFVGEAAAALEVIIGTDDRVRITRTSQQPWSRICALRIQFPSGKTYRGTAFLIGPRVLATAGHCVYMQDEGGWARRITVVPGANGNLRPFGQVVATSFRSVGGWVRGRRPECDYGCILLPAVAFGGRNLGSFGFAAFDARVLLAQPAVVAGYPGDKPFGQAWGMSRRIKAVTAKTLVYDIDTMGGQSGAPVYIKRGGQRYLVGIHNYGAATGNSATRVIQPVYERLRSWSRLGGAGGVGGTGGSGGLGGGRGSAT